MNRNLMIIALAILSTFNSKAQVVKHVNAYEFKQLVDSKEGIILDVRTPGEVAKAHIQGTSTINIADKDFIAKINMIQKDKAIYVYCLTGSRSRTAARYMEQNGFTNVYNLAQGVISWYRAGYPLVAEQNIQAKTSTAYTEESIKNIINSNNVVLVDFNATWCAPCKTMLPVVDKLAKDPDTVVCPNCNKVSKLE